MCALNVRSGKAPFDGGKVFPGCGRELELAILGAFNYVDIGVLQNEESTCSMALRLLTQNPSARPFSVSPGLSSGKIVLRGGRDATNVARELQRAGPDREKWFPMTPCASARPIGKSKRNGGKGQQQCEGNRSQTWEIPLMAPREGINELPFAMPGEPDRKIAASLARRKEA